MSTAIKADEIAATFEKIRKEQGEDSFLKARRDFAVNMISKPRGEEFLKATFPDLDLEPLRAEAAEMAQHRGEVKDAKMQEAMLGALRQQIPNLKTQAQYNIFVASFEALKNTLNSAFGRDRVAFGKGLEVLNQSLEAAFTISEVVEKLRENPEAASSKESEEFKVAPRQFQEFDVQRSLIVDLQGVKTAEALTAWYEANRSRMDDVVSQSLRNELFDAVRKRKQELLS